MVGKRNQFKLFTVTKAVSTKTNVRKTEKVLKSDEEEMEDDDDKADEENDNIKMETEKVDVLPKAISRGDISDTNSTEPENETQIEKKEDSDENLEKPNISSESCSTEEESIVARKRRNRLRMRSKRQEVDIDDLVEHETSDKYAKWIPPVNQTGDGLTSLNEKFGY